MEHTFFENVIEVLTTVFCRFEGLLTNTKLLNKQTNQQKRTTETTAETENVLHILFPSCKSKHTLLL